MRDATSFLKKLQRERTRVQDQSERVWTSLCREKSGPVPKMLERLGALVAEHERAQRRLILGEPVVLYRTGDGAPVALEDRCAHRHLPLSMGKLVGDTLQCLYHGLRFARDGHCVYIPGQEQIPQGAKVRCYPVIERYHWIWIWMGDPALADPAAITDFHWLDDPNWGAKGDYLHVNANWQLVVDNLLDLTHLAFVHDTTPPRIREVTVTLAA